MGHLYFCFINSLIFVCFQYDGRSDGLEGNLRPKGSAGRFPFRDRRMYMYMQWYNRETVVVALVHSLVPAPCIAILQI